MVKNNHKQTLWEKQVKALRDPVSVVTGEYNTNGITKNVLQYKVDDSFSKILKKLNITLLMTREYEHLVIALNASENKLHQSFFHLPHPSGIAVDRKNNSVFIAATRNPNCIWEFKPMKSLLARKDENYGESEGNYLTPARSKYFAGAYYFHDLAMIENELYANSVGQNGIVRVDFANSSSDSLVWWPKSLEDKKGHPNTQANYIQLNSIAAGKDLESSFFSASGIAAEKRRPGQRNYPVDKKGVIFSGKTRDVIATGLTRPHSARLYKNQLWVANSGYGQVGYIENETFIPQFSLPGWTRGLCIYKDILFVGVSRVLPRFKKYAPGLDLKFQSCGIYAINLKTKKIIGSLIWPNGSQIFAIEFIDSNISTGFIFNSLKKTTKKQKNIFYRFQV